MRGAENVNKKVAQAFEALRQHSCIAVVQKELSGQESYLILSLTDKGRASVRQGKYLWLVD